MILFLISVALLGLLFLLWRLASQRYSLPCPTWLSWMVERDNPFTNVNRAATIIEHLQPQPGMSVIDIGCGPGRLTIPLSKAVGPNGKVVAMDIQAGMLDKVKVQREGLNNITFLNAGVGQGQLPRAAFDKAVLVTVLGEIPDQAAALQEIYSTLKPGGILSITELVFDPHFQRQSSVNKICDKIGFEKLQTFGSWYAYTTHFRK